MTFWIGILFSAVFAYIGIRKGFYDTWILFFNIAVSIYLAVFLCPVITAMPSVADTPYCGTFSIIFVAITSFFILHGLSYLLFTELVEIPLPGIFESFASGLIGFISGFLIWSFLILVGLSTPFLQNSLSNYSTAQNKPNNINISWICSSCDIINSFVSAKSRKIPTIEVIETIIHCSDPNSPQTSLETHIRSKPDANI